MMKDLEWLCKKEVIQKDKGERLKNDWKRQRNPVNDK